jgi:outer membrane protein TolC
MLERLFHLLPLTLLAALASLTLRGQTPLSIQDAIRTAWISQSGLQAGAARVDQARAQAAAQDRLRLPTVSLGMGYTRTDEPMQAFGTRLDEARITQADFLPASLNRPAAVSGTGATLTLSQPLYAGGRLDAARRAGQAMAGAEAASQEQRRQQAALAITQVYFGAQMAEQGVRYAEDSLKQAVATDAFVQARVAEGLLLRSDGERTQAYRAQCEVALLEARARVASARSGLALLVGADVAGAQLSTPLDAPAAVAAVDGGQRPDLASLRQQATAAQEGVKAAQGSLKPEVGVQLTAGTLRQAWDVGGNWTTLSVGAKWTFSFADGPRVNAARAEARAAELEVHWQAAVADREVQEARRAVQTAQAKIAFARTAVTASESVRAIRTARHREGLLPLVEVLDAETSLSGSRTLLLASQLDLRLGEAQLALALGQPIEAVKE